MTVRSPTVREGRIRATMCFTHRRLPSPLGRRVGDEGLVCTPNTFKCVREMISLNERNHLSLRHNEFDGAQALTQPSPKGRGLKRVLQFLPSSSGQCPLQAEVNPKSHRRFALRAHSKKGDAYFAD